MLSVNAKSASIAAMFKRTRVIRTSQSQTESCKSKCNRLQPSDVYEIKIFLQEMSVNPSRAAMTLRLRLDRLRLDDLQPDGIGGVVHGGDHRELLVRSRRQRRSRGRRLDQNEAIFPRDEKVFFAFLHHAAAGHDLYQQEGRTGLLR